MKPALFLIGLICSTNPKHSIAVFGIETGSTMLHMSDTIYDYRLIAVQQDGVILEHKSKRIYLRSGSGIDDFFQPPRITQGIERDNTTIRVSSVLRDYVVKDGIASIVMQASSEPVYVGDEVIGYRILDIDVGSIFELAGLKNGDIIEELDHIKITSPLSALRSLARLKDLNEFEFRFIRDAVSQVIKVEIR